MGSADSLGEGEGGGGKALMSVFPREVWAVGDTTAHLAAVAVSKVSDPCSHPPRLLLFRRVRNTLPPNVQHLAKEGFNFGDIRGQHAATGEGNQHQAQESYTLYSRQGLRKGRGDAGVVQTSRRTTGEC
ncbi:uncharacterized protein LOC123518401 [Portunus trituberculatus]|uniref:uncharacterized protein LOC123518401 n=1 Tax=Portunus trituberculatus TaxID=210409 RepID=UPI001E1CDC74|nr:uncharacterized protein LOC123518401 [Portunus trituberculatus]